MPRPINRYVLIDPENSESKETATGILVPNIDFELLCKGTVVETWSPEKDEHGVMEVSKVRPADVVMFLHREKEKRLTLVVDSRELYVVKEEEIIIIL